MQAPSAGWRQVQTHRSGTDVHDPCRCRGRCGIDSDTSRQPSWLAPRSRRVNGTSIPRCALGGRRPNIAGSIATTTVPSAPTRSSRRFKAQGSYRAVFPRYPTRQLSPRGRFRRRARSLCIGTVCKRLCRLRQLVGKGAVVSTPPAQLPERCPRPTQDADHLVKPSAAGPADAILSSRLPPGRASQGRREPKFGQCP